jgi:L-cysteine S-thiosulfotransferase
MWARRLRATALKRLTLASLALTLPALIAVHVAAQVTSDSPLPKRFFEQPRSGASFASEEIRKLQDDELSNPAQLLVDQARVLWAQSPPKGKSCEGCHGTVERLKGVATHYPKMVNARGLSNLEGAINACRSERQGESPWKYESAPLLGLTALIASQSPGQRRGASPPAF